MRASVTVVESLVARLEAGDELEAEHRRLTLDWLGGTDDVFRRVKPATPDRHLVSYVVPVDPRDGAILLVDHVNAGLCPSTAISRSWWTRSSSGVCAGGRRMS